MNKPFTRWGLILGALACLMVIVFNGCHSNSYFDPSRTASTGLSYGSHLSARASMTQTARVHRESLPAGSLPALNEEVWVVIKPDKIGNENAQPATESDVPGCGGIVCRMPDAEQPDKIIDVPLPLKHTEVRSQIGAYIATVDVTQEFVNPFDSKIEAVYVFPLPTNAAVNGFVMSIGDRKIRGVIRERQEAQRIYEEAKRQGHVASLLNQERPNIFMQHVANIEPGKQVDVNITYFHTLAYDDGWYEFIFPMVVGPRFNPPGTEDGIGSVGRGMRGSSQQSVEVQYLRPNERSGHDINIAVDIDAAVSIEEIICANHKVQISHESSERVRVALEQQDRIPNKDFVLRYRVAGDQVKSGLLVHRDQSGQGYFTFMLFPPAAEVQQQRQAMEMIFVIDCSGSMNGAPIKQAKAAVDYALGALEPSDTFQIVQFSNTSSQLGPEPLLATRENVRKGQRYVDALKGEGGTMMIEGIKAALDFDHDPERLRFVTFLTDGYIGNEAQILGEIHRGLGASRIFSFGVGSSPNRYLMDRMAKVGRGAVAYLGLNDSGADVMNGFFSRISRPVLTDISLDWADMEVSDVTPSQIPDLFIGRPVILTGKFNGSPQGAIRVNGKAAGQTVQASFAMEPEAVGEHSTLASVWARLHIAELMDQSMWNENPELPGEIKEIALQYGLMSAYTSFVAVDSSSRTAGTEGTTVHVSVPVPEGVKYETAVQEQ